MSLDFFKGVNNLNQGRTYQRNDSGRDFNRGPVSPSSPQTQSRSIRDRRDVNENIHVHHQQDHVSGHCSRAHPYPSHQEYRQLHQFIPNEHPRSIEPATNNYNIPNAPFFQTPPFPYNEGPPRTSAHFHGCPTCSSPIMVQVTANLSYHHVTLICAPTAKNSYTESTLPSHGAQEYSPNPESIPQTYGPESSDDDSLSNDMVLAAAFEKQLEMVTAPRAKVQPLLSVETKERRSYASITAGKTIITENHYKPSEEEAEGDKPPLEEEANSVKPSEGEANSVKPSEGEANYVKPSEEEDAKDNNEVDVAYDINGFTTVVSSKSKKKAKAEAKAAAIAARKKMFSKHRKWAERDEHDKQHHRNDRGARREHDQHAKGWPRDGKDKHHGRVANDIGQRHT